jgi:hypothetical protein
LVRAADESAMENVRSKSWRVYRARCAGPAKSRSAARCDLHLLHAVALFRPSGKGDGLLQRIARDAARLAVLEKMTLPTTVPKAIGLLPILDLRKAPNGGANFTYTVSAILAPDERPTGELFDSVESCLYDAGTALRNYFDGVQIRYDGIALGTYAVSRLVNDPLGLFDELLQRLIATFRMRTRSHAAAPRATRSGAVTIAAPITGSTTGDRHDS